MIKTIGYAFPTSPTAEQLGVAKYGCYFVATTESETNPNYRETFGPFATIEAAEIRAAEIDLPWSRYSKRAPA